MVRLGFERFRWHFVKHKLDLVRQNTDHPRGKIIMASMLLHSYAIKSEIYTSKHGASEPPQRT